MAKIDEIRKAVENAIASIPTREVGLYGGGTWTAPDVEKMVRSTPVGGVLKKGEAVDRALKQKFGMAYEAPKAVGKFAAGMATFLPEQAMQTGYRLGNILGSKKMTAEEKVKHGAVQSLPLIAALGAGKVGGKLAGKLAGKIPMGVVGGAARGAISGAVSGGAFGGTKAGAEEFEAGTPIAEATRRVLGGTAMGAGSGALLGGVLGGVGEGRALKQWEKKARGPLGDLTKPVDPKRLKIQKYNDENGEGYAVLVDGGKAVSTHRTKAQAQANVDRILGRKMEELQSTINVGKPKIVETTKTPISEIMESNRLAGENYFSPDTMKFWKSKTHGDAINGYFITSERNYNNTAREYSIRKFNPTTGSIDTVGDFQGFGTLKQAQKALNKVATENPVQGISGTGVSGLSEELRNKTDVKTLTYLAQKARNPSEFFNYLSPVQRDVMRKGGKGNKGVADFFAKAKEQELVTPPSEVWRVNTPEGKQVSQKEAGEMIKTGKYKMSEPAYQASSKEESMVGIKGAKEPTVVDQKKVDQFKKLTESVSKKWENLKYWEKNFLTKENANNPEIKKEYDLLLKNYYDTVDEANKTGLVWVNGEIVPAKSFDYPTPNVSGVEKPSGGTSRVFINYAKPNQWVMNKETGDIRQVDFQGREYTYLKQPDSTGNDAIHWNDTNKWIVVKPPKGATSGTPTGGTGLKVPTDYSIDPPIKAGRGFYVSINKGDVGIGNIQYNVMGDTLQISDMKITDNAVKNKGYMGTALNDLVKKYNIKKIVPDTDGYTSQGREFIKSFASANQGTYDRGVVTLGTPTTKTPKSISPSQAEAMEVDWGGKPVISKIRSAKEDQFMNLFRLNEGTNERMPEARNFIKTLSDSDLDKAIINLRTKGIIPNLSLVPTPTSDSKIMKDLANTARSYGVNDVMGENDDTLARWTMTQMVSGGKNVSKHYEKVRDAGKVLPISKEIENQMTAAGITPADRPAHQVALENAINAGNKQEAYDVWSKIPANDPYKQSMLSVLNTAFGGKAAKEPTTEIGITSFRGTPVKTVEETQPYFETPRAKGFQRALNETMAKYNLVKESVEKQVAGFWEGKIEPSFLVRVKGTQSDVLKYASENGTKGNQDAVALFREGNDVGAKYTFGNVTDPNSFLSFLNKNGISGATVDKNNVIVYDTDSSILNKVLKLGKEIGYEPKITKGTVKFLEKSEYPQYFQKGTGGDMGGSVPSKLQTQTAVQQGVTTAPPVVVPTKFKTVSNEQAARGFVSGEAVRSNNLIQQVLEDGTRILYSYGKHFPLSIIKPDGTAYMNSDKYSSTTSHHAGMVRRALESAGMKAVSLATDAMKKLIE